MQASLEILKALKSAKVVIALLSSESSDRPWVAFEAGFAHGNAAAFFPLRVRDAKPPYLGFRIRYEGVRPLTLQAIVAGIPWSSRDPFSMLRAESGHLRTERKPFEGVDYIFTARHSRNQKMKAFPLS